MSDFAEFKSEMPRMAEVQQPAWGGVQLSDNKMLADSAASSQGNAGDFLPKFHIDGGGSISFNTTDGNPGAQGGGDNTTHANRALDATFSTSSAPALEALQQSNPNLAKILTDAQSQVSPNFYHELVSLVSQDAANGLAPTDSGLMNDAIIQIKQLYGTSAADVSTLQGIVKSDLTASGDAQVNTSSAGVPVPGNVNPGGPEVPASVASTPSSDTSASSAPGTDSSASSGSNPLSNLQSSEQQLMQDIQNGASQQQIDQDIIGFLDTLMTDISSIETELQGGSDAGTGAGSAPAVGSAENTVPTTGGNTYTPFVPDPGAGPNAEAGVPPENFGPTTGSGSGSSVEAPPATGSGSGSSVESPPTTTTTVDNPAPPVTGSGGSSATAAQNAEGSVALITANTGGNNEELGTAFAVNSTGLYATDDHVVINAQGKIAMQLANGQTVYGDVVYQDQANDLALIQVEGAGNQQSTPVQLASTPSATDSAIGFPDAGPLQVDSGQYAGLATYGSFDVTGSPVASNPNREMDQFNNMDAQPGSSGSPIFDSSGQVVSIVDIGNGYGATDGTLASALQTDIANYEA